MKKHGSPVRIFTNIHPQKIKLSADEGYRYKILLTFFIEDFFFNRNQEKFVKYIQVKTKLLLTFSLVILPFYGIMGGKYMHLYVYPVCEFSCACTCMNMNIYWWCSYTDSFFISHTVYSLSSSWNILWLYRFCAVCKRYSAKENIHCDVCDSCPTKVRGLQIQAELLYIEGFFTLLHLQIVSFCLYFPVCSIHLSE